MIENELLELFLSQSPDSTHPEDRKRFLAYALECANNGHYINLKAMREHRLSEEDIEDYEIAFGWIRDTKDYLSNKETL